MLDIAILATYFKLLSQKGIFREYRLSFYGETRETWIQGKVLRMADRRW